MHQKIDKKNKVYIYLFIFFLLSTLNNKQFLKTNLFKFNIDHIKVSGLSEKKNIQISDEIKNILVENIFFIKKEIFLEILKRNNLINSFEIKKIYPNTIEIKLYSSYTKSSVSRDKKGKTSKYNIVITTDFYLISNNEEIKKITITEKIGIKNISDAFQQKKYERKIKKDLSRSIAQKFVEKLSTYK